MVVKVKVYTISDILENEVIDVVGSYEQAVSWVFNNRGETYKFKGDGEVVIEEFTVWTQVVTTD